MGHLSPWNTSEALSLSLSDLLWHRVEEWEVLSWKNIQLLAQAWCCKYLWRRCSPAKQSWTCYTNPWKGLCLHKYLRICSLPTNLRPPHVLESQARLFARLVHLVQQGQDFPHDPSPLERPGLPESLDLPAVKRTRQIISNIRPNPSRTISTPFSDLNYVTQSLLFWIPALFYQYIHRCAYEDQIYAGFLLPFMNTFYKRYHLHALL